MEFFELHPLLLVLLITIMIEAWTALEALVRTSLERRQRA